MLNLLVGRARTGKTRLIMEEIKRRMSQGESGMLLIVPEQYSHDAERQLCSVCGDSLSLHAETLSFTRLCEHVFSETGCPDRRILDKSGQILVMHKALEAALSSLKVFGTKKLRTEILEKLVETVTEFKGLCITVKDLEKAAEMTQKPLNDKLSDLALIMDAYEAVLKAYGNDPATRLELLEKYITDSSVGDKGHIYIDGFIDFTAQELRIIEKLLLKGAEITISITSDPKETAANTEIFKIPQRTIERLCQMPVKTAVTTACNNTVAGDTRVTAPDISHMESYLFDDEPKKYPEKSDAISVYEAPTKYVECEYAAAKIWELVKSGYRWCEIGVMARNWEQYETVCETVFEKYGIPYFSGGKVDINTKPPIALIDTALEIATTGWEYKSVFKYLKTGLLKLDAGDMAILENYVLTWKIRGSLWQREWTMPPYGYKKPLKEGKEKDTNEKLLRRINEIRVKVVKPLKDLNEGIKGESSAQTKLHALYKFMSDLGLSQVLQEKAEDFKKRGYLKFADEYTQLLQIMTDAIDQMFMILSESVVNEFEFRKLISLVLSQHDVGVIPIALDRTPLGGMIMSRRRDIKCLILLGSTDENMPTLGQDGRILSENERTQLAGLDLNISAGIEERMCREMNLLYSTLTLPSDKLIMIYPTDTGSRPSIVIKKLCDMFGITKQSLTEEEYMSAAESPYLELKNRYRNKYEPAEREPLTKEAAKLIYSSEITLSATQADRYYSCPYKHFLQNGLRLAPRIKAEFDAASAGNFMHHVLDGVFGEIKKTVGFKKADEALCAALTEKYAKKFTSEVLLDFEGKDTRFKYLFERYKETAAYVVSDMVSELKSSEFEPYELEMDLSGLSGSQSGFIDRTDGYIYDNKLYMRIIDYKTRKKTYAFDLCDIYHGRDMQMLIYLFALEKYGAAKFGMQIEPAGVLYAPARDNIIATSRNANDDEIAKKRLSDMRRSGLVLDNAAIIDAMESGESKRYLPVNTAKDGTYTGAGIVSRQRIVLLSGHIENKLSAAKKEILSGNNACKPYYKNSYENACTYCEYFPVCRFDEQTGDSRKFTEKMKPDEVWQKIEHEKE